MIKKNKAQETVVKFGLGSVKLEGISQGSFGAMKISECAPSKMGFVKDGKTLTEIKNSSKIILSFPSTKSLDIFIRGLENLRSSMEK